MATVISAIAWVPPGKAKEKPSRYVLSTHEEALMKDQMAAEDEMAAAAEDGADDGEEWEDVDDDGNSEKGDIAVEPEPADVAASAAAAMVRSFPPSFPLFHPLFLPSFPF